MKKITSLCASFLLLATPTWATTPEITQQDVLDAVRNWCNGLLHISETNRSNGDAKTAAVEILNSAYAYDQGKVLFKPTLTFGDQTFRLTKEGALAYFVGGNPDYPDDSGFALNDWTEADFTTAGVLVEGNTGLYMGNVILTDGKGNKTIVDKTFAFRFDDDKHPRIILHKSALPFVPAETSAGATPAGS
jgi:hypothetical protein